MVKRRTQRLEDVLEDIDRRQETWTNRKPHRLETVNSAQPELQSHIRALRDLMKRYEENVGQWKTIVSQLADMEGDLRDLAENAYYVDDKAELELIDFWWRVGWHLVD